MFHCTQHARTLEERSENTAVKGHKEVIDSFQCYSDNQIIIFSIAGIMKDFILKNIYTQNG